MQRQNGTSAYTEPPALHLGAHHRLRDASPVTLLFHIPYLGPADHRSPSRFRSQPKVDTDALGSEIAEADVTNIETIGKEQDE
ncbi:hypothetical protein DMB37_04830 [Nocardia sp. CS682]|nr:hypothetical protein DMB37_04830 [Nocardia sp. CS682]